QRHELVVAALTVLRAYDVAGRPTKVKAMGAFEDWSWIRGALMWLDCADPADTREEIFDSDPKKQDLADVMDLWKYTVGCEQVTTSDLQRRAQDEDRKAYAGDQLGGPYTTLCDRLREATGRTQWSSKSVGWWLLQQRGRVVDGRYFDKHEGGKQSK